MGRSLLPRIKNRVSRIGKEIKALFAPKIFCISMQRTGTTSVGKFFMDHGFRVATWPIQRRNKWTYSWFRGDLETIFRSYDFKTHQVYEDDPWWVKRFYTVLYHKFPRSKFVLFERDEDEWFNSMLRHSNGMNPGNTYRHAYNYNRFSEYYSKFGDKEVKYNEDSIDNMLSMREMRRHYTEFYITRNQSVKDFFSAHKKSRLINLRLEDPDKWQKLGCFFGIKVDPDYNVHANASNPDAI